MERRPPVEVLETDLDSPTLSYTGDGSPATSDPGERQFLPGTQLGKRYRLVELLGQGGMGEVYRADDLQLGHPVALKFLPSRLTGDPAALARLRNEVKLARQISHPNVCRVHDIGEADGYYFLSMEHIDGEDLGSVLRRLGRPTQEKSVEIARQVCSGLAAAHEAGVLHRDLKPANIMIDGRGRARITDFGLASLVHEAPTRRAAGTPQYMAPELFRGGSPSARSDIYALGAVMFEMFTGEGAFEGRTLAEIRDLQTATSGKRPSDIVAGIEPIVEEVILRCLEKDPSKRPVSPLAVAGMLPGQDPVAAALAAGRTPSPDIVAAAGGMGALHPLVAIGCFLGVLVGLLLIAGLNRRVSLHGLVPPAKPAVVLADRAREILASVGHPEPPAHVAYGWERYSGYLDHIENEDTSPDRWAGLRDQRPPVHLLWYRESPVPLSPQNVQQEVRFHDPPQALPGMAGVKLDDLGRLAVLRVKPPQLHQPDTTHGPVDYRSLFLAAGLEPDQFEPVEPRWTPPTFADRHQAWTGHYPERPAWPLRVEAASYAGRPVYFNVLEAFDEPWTGPRPDERSAMRRSGEWVAFTVMMLALLVPPVMARRNLRRGTGDKTGALRLGVTLWVLSLISWVLWADHTSDFEAEARMAFVALGISVLAGVWSGLVYLALEPYVRRLLPNTLIAWTRLLMGRVLDPRVGRDVLVGAVSGTLVIVVQRLEWLVPTWLGTAPGDPYGGATAALEGGRKAWAIALDPSFLVGPLVLLLTLTFLLFLLRRVWLAVTATIVIWAMVDGHYWNADGPLVVQAAALIEVVIVWSIIVYTLTRFGLLAIVTAYFFFGLLQSWPILLDTSVWFRGVSFAGIALLAAIAALAARISVGRRAFAG